MNQIRGLTLQKPYASILVYGAAFTLLANTVFFIGWVLDISVLITIIPGTASIKFNTVICFILLGVCQLLFVYNSMHKLLIWLFTAIVFITGLMVLMQYGFQLSFGIDEYFFKDKGELLASNTFPGRMSPIAAICFLLIGRDRKSVV